METENLVVEMRKCKGECGLEKPLDEFVKRPEAKSNGGYRNICKVCINKQRAERYKNYKQDKIIPDWKECCDCFKVLFANQFILQPLNNDGLSNYCKNCHTKNHCDQKGNEVKKLEGRKCAHCELFKPASEFNQNKKIGLEPYCKSCLRETRLAKRIENPELFMLNAAKSRAVQGNFIFDLKISDIIIPQFCPILGIPLFKNDRKEIFNSPNSPSLDKIIPHLGYVSNNIVVCSFLANIHKKDASWEEMEALYQNFYNISCGPFVDDISKQRKLATKATKRTNERVIFNITITYKDIKIPETCPVLGIKLRMNNHTAEIDSPSVDRIYNDKGYTPDNIRIISHRANSLKGSLSFDEWEKIYIFYQKFFKQLI